VERDDLANVVDVGVGAVGEHGPAAGEPELVAVDADPVLHRLLDGKLLVRHVGEPGDVAAGGPRERGPVPARRGDEAPQPLPLRRRAVALPVHQPVPRVPQRPLHVLARGVLGVPDGARGVPPRRCRRGGGGGAGRGGGCERLVRGRRVVRGEVEGPGWLGGGGAGPGAGRRGLLPSGGCGGGGAGDGGGDGDGGGLGRGGEAAVLPDAEEVGGGAEEQDGDERQEGGAPRGRRRDVQLRRRQADTHGAGACLACLPLAPAPAAAPSGES
jgi:hypothetical protein